MPTQQGGRGLFRIIGQPWEGGRERANLLLREPGLLASAAAAARAASPALLSCSLVMAGWLSTPPEAKAIFSPGFRA